MVTDLVAQVAGAFEQMVPSAPVEAIHESYRSTIVSLQRDSSHACCVIIKRLLPLSKRNCDLSPNEVSTKQKSIFVNWS